MDWQKKQFSKTIIEKQELKVLRIVMNSMKKAYWSQDLVSLIWKILVMWVLRVFSCLWMYIFFTSILSHFFFMLLMVQGSNKFCSQIAPGNRWLWFPTQKNLIFKKCLNLDFDYIQNILVQKPCFCVNKKTTFENNMHKWEYGVKKIS